jgi:hypothetical protein
MKYIVLFLILAIIVGYLYAVGKALLKDSKKED